MLDSAHGSNIRGSADLRLIGVLAKRSQHDDLHSRVPVALPALYALNESNLFKQELDTDSGSGFLYRSVLLTNPKSGVINPDLFATLRLRANVIRDARPPISAMHVERHSVLDLLGQS